MFWSGGIGHDGRTDQNNGACRCAGHNRSKGTKPPNYPHTHDTS
jgi:hypothetical protein